MKNSIPYGRQSINKEDIESVIKILESDWLTQGPTIAEFEQACASYCQAKYAVAVCNATSALHLACLALDIGAGDRVWATPNTFVASSNCALYCGASVDFVDIDPNTYNFCEEKFKKKLIIASKKNNLPKAIIVTHFAGQSCEMINIKKLAEQYDIKIIEDASHAIGGKYQNNPIGNCQYSDIVVFSFHPVKIITTAEGGMILTNSELLKNKIELLRTHGITRNAELMQGQNEGGWYYQQIDLGFNYRMTDIQAALGLSQLSRIDSFIERRHAIAKNYDVLLSTLPVTIPWQSPHCYSAYHLYPIQLKLEESSKTRNDVYDALRKAKIGVNVHYIPVHMQPYYQKFGFKKGDYPCAEFYYQRAISLPIFFEMTNDEQDYVVNELKNILMD